MNNDILAVIRQSARGGETESRRCSSHEDQLCLSHKTQNYESGHDFARWKGKDTDAMRPPRRLRMGSLRRRDNAGEPCQKGSPVHDTSIEHGPDGGTLGRQAGRVKRLRDMVEFKSKGAIPHRITRFGREEVSVLNNVHAD